MEQNRREKFWHPRDVDGEVLVHISHEHIDYSEGEWLVLARNGYLVNKVDRSVTGKVAMQQCIGPFQTPLSNYSIQSLGYSMHLDEHETIRPIVLLHFRFV